ncbi:hypothetical protein EYF80_042885 [Liparis tanakae]|uniref:Uncharacterized protein n=1 Tax=Liparis tanakae TaxID=230148 RepID=A0A4Z2G233_9TELE|nr:hypothetical protein EYF80_042885 [Liparis tanakae]
MSSLEDLHCTKAETSVTTPFISMETILTGMATVTLSLADHSSFYGDAFHWISSTHCFLEPLDAIGMGATILRPQLADQRDSINKSINTSE